MADCSKIERELQEALQQQSAARRLKRSVDAEAKATAQMEAEEAATGAKRFRTFSMLDGTKIRINPREFYKQVEQDNIGLGEEKIRELVRARFDNNAKPAGSEGLNINYAEMDFNEENTNILLELAGVRRMGSEAGQELAMEFTEEAARDELLDNIRMMGGEPSEIARAMGRDTKALKRLPIVMVMAKKMKFDSARYYADLLEDSATLIDTFGISPKQQARLSRASQFVHFFEQFDALISRKTAQALRSRQFVFADLNSVTDDLNFSNIEALDLDTLKEGSLASQVSEAILQGNAEDLRKLARAKRVGALNNIGINEGTISAQVRILNNLRRDNMFLSPSTWTQRNVVAGALVNFSYGAEDFYAMGIKNSKRDALRASTFAFRNMTMGMQAAFGNAFESLLTGKPTFTSAGIKEGLDPQSLVNRKANNNAVMLQTRDQLIEAWAEVFERPESLGDVANIPGKAFGTTFVTTPLAALNLLSTAARYLLGNAIEKLPGGSTMGFSPGFSLLAGGDEVTRKMAFDWKASFTAYENALKEWDELIDKPAGISKAQWVADRANERAEKAVFAPEKMTTDELAVIRRQAGGLQFGDMSDDALRLKLFNDRAGTPNLGTPEGRAGAQRGAEATFTQPVTGNIGAGIQRIRQNPLGGWVMPVFQTPANGLKWLLSRDAFIALPKTYLQQQRQAKGVKAGDAPYTADEMADAYARAINALFISSATYGLWQSGVFRDGGSFNRDQRRRENNPAFGTPYSFAIGAFQFLGLSKLSVPGASIDLVDLMGLQADMFRAFHENLIKEQDVEELMVGVQQAYMRVLDNKSTLDGVMDILNFFSRGALGNDVDFSQALSSQMNGVLPLSGFLTAASRGLQNPNEKQMFGRRQMSATEITALQKDPNWGLFQKFAAKVARNYPILGTIGYQYQDKDWLMRDRRRPFGIPLDFTAPFAMVTVSDTPLDKWLVKHGLGNTPRESGKVGGSDLGLKNASPTTMSIDEERTYRTEMNLAIGEVPVETILGKSNALIDTGINQYNVNDYVKGNTLVEALTALSEDPRYEQDLTLPNGPSISTTQLPYFDQSLAERTKRDNDPRGVYRVFNAVVNYYDRLGLMGMIRQHPDFRAKAAANAKRRGERAIEDLRASPLGLSRQ